MSETKGPVLVATAEPTAAPKLNAIQLIEQELRAFIQQREQAVANVHAVEGAIQASQRLLQVLRSEAGKAEAAVETGAAKVVELAKEIL